MKKATIRPELYTTRTNKQGFAPIRLVCQYRADRKIIPTDIKVRPDNWSIKDRAAIHIKLQTFQRLKKIPTNILPPDYSLMPLVKHIEIINKRLQDKISEVEAIETELLKANKQYTIADIVNEYKKKYQGTGIVSEPKIYIADFIDEYVAKNKGLIKPRTLQAYSNLNNHLKGYIEKKKDKPAFESFTYSKIKAFHAYLIETGINNTTIGKLISTLKTLIKAAVREDKKIQVCPDFRDYSVTRKDSDHEVIALSQDEFNALLDLDLTDYDKQDYYNAYRENGVEQISVSYRTLDRVRDLFVFSCVTGLRYSDLAGLRREHIRNNTIYKKSVKTGQLLEIPLNAISSFILEKYSDELLPLPEYSNQRANDYLKTLGRMAGINETIERSREYGTETRSTIHKKYELMSLHMGRRTFASLTLEKGVASQDVMSLTGHKKFASFKRYMNISSKQKQKAMSVWGEVSSDNNLKAAK